MIAALCAEIAAAGCTARARPERENGRIVVTFWYALGDLLRKVLLDLVGRYNRSQTAIVVRPVHQGDYFEALAKLRAALAAGVAPPLSHVVLEVLPYLASAGVLEPLDDYPGAASLGLLPALSQERSFSAAPRATFGIPFNRSIPIAYCNGRILRDEGVRVPATWPDLEAAATRLTQRSGETVTRWGFEVPISWWYWVAMAEQAGGHLVDPDGTMTLGGAGGEAALTFLQRLVRTDRVMRPPPGGDYQAWQSTTQSFLQERVAMMWSSTALLRYVEGAAPFPVVVAPLPRFVTQAVPTGGTLFVLLRSAPEEEKAAAWSFIRWMCEPAQSAEWAERTGYLPVTRGAVERLGETGHYARHVNDWVAYEQLARAVPWPWAPELFRVERDIVEPLLQEAVLTGRDAHDTMQEARRRAREPA